MKFLFKNIVWLFFTSLSAMPEARAQQIIAVEYFFDSDPGYGIATNVPIITDSIISNFTFNADMSALSNGLHTLYIRAKDANGKWSVTNNQFVYKFQSLSTSPASTISKLEYFIDVDPGFGNGIDVPVSNNSIISNFLFNADISALSNGLHTLYIRTKDVNGKWSVTNNQFLYKFQPLSNSPTTTIAKLEYFIDVDPGFGNGIDVPLSNDSIISNFLFNADMSALSNGLHTLYIRTKDANGKWSVINNQFVYKFQPLSNSPTTTIAKLEYFIDVDPGFGNGIDVPVSNDSLISNFLFNADMSALSNGLHTLYIRTKDATGKWSVTNNQFVYKFQPLSNSPSTTIAKLEYFIDIDPGFGNGIDVPLSNDSIISNFLFNADMTALSNGLHTLYIRTKDANEKWSVSNNQFVYKFQPLSNSPTTTIAKLEYFIDVDPGFGNGIDVPLSNDSLISNFLFNADMSALSNGLHTLYIRTKDANGKWSVTNNQFVYKFQTLNTSPLPAITALEYFVDADPGYGNGISIPFISDSIVTNITFIVDTSGLSYGSHVLSVRSKNALGKWSVVNAIRFTRDNFKLFLQGYYVGSNTMAPVIMNQGLSNDASLTDSIDVELHNTLYPYALVAKTKSIINTNGIIPCTFTNVNGSYYIVIKHRNTVQTWSASPVVVGSLPMTYNFTTSASKAYGSNMKQVSNGVWAFYTGDISQDGNIDLLDLSIQENDINNFSLGYDASDLNGDGNVDLLDSPMLETNISNFIFSHHP